MKLEIIKKMVSLALIVSLFREEDNLLFKIVQSGPTLLILNVFTSLNRTHFYIPICVVDPNIYFKTNITNENLQ